MYNFNGEIVTDTDLGEALIIFDKVVQKYNFDEFKKLVNNIGNDFNSVYNYPKLDDTEYKVMINMKKFVGDDKLLNLYEKYKNMPKPMMTGGGITDFLKKKLTIENIRYAVYVLSENTKKLIVAATPIIANAVINNPDIVNGMIVIVHNNITVPIIEASIDDIDAKKSIYKGFDVALNSLRIGLNEASLNNKKKSQYGGFEDIDGPFQPDEQPEDDNIYPIPENKYNEMNELNDYSVTSNY